MSTQRFVVDGDVFARLPGMRLVVVAVSGLDNDQGKPAIDKLLDDTWAQAHAWRDQYANPQSHPHVACWRTALRGLGVSVRDHPASIEALLRRAFKVPEPVRINPLTDLLHMVSLTHVVPVGAFDLDRIDGDLALRPTRAGEPFVALDDAEPALVEAGEVAYADDSTIHTRYFVWRQAKQSLVDPSTRRAVLVAEVLAELDDSIAPAVAGDFTAGVWEHFGVHPALTVIDADNLTAEMPE